MSAARSQKEQHLPSLQIFKIFKNWSEGRWPYVFTILGKTSLIALPGRKSGKCAAPLRWVVARAVAPAHRHISVNGRLPTGTNLADR